jgi:hypothetical protein
MQAKPKAWLDFESFSRLLTDGCMNMDKSLEDHVCQKSLLKMKMRFIVMENFYNKNFAIKQ